MFCRDNWLHFDFDGLPKRVKNEDMRVWFTEKADRVLPFHDAAIATAKEIAAQHNDIYVAMSGGCDSEYIAKAFLAAGVPFKAIMLTCRRYFRVGEWYADKWCADNGVELIKYDVEIEDFFAQGKRVSGILRAISWLPAAMTMLADEVKRRGGQLTTGGYPAYHPDRKLTLLKAEPAFADSFKGFMLDEADFYIEMMDPGYHPSNFFFYNVDMFASTIAHWDITQPNEENKWRMMELLPRPKQTGGEIFYANNLANYVPEYREKTKWFFLHEQFGWGTRDFAPLADQTELLKQIVK